MTTFLVRVQLENGTNEDYTNLKDKLVSAGFTKKVVDKNGVAYTLPNGNYLGSSEKDKMEVLTIVNNIAKTVKRKFMTLITESSEKGMAWAGLGYHMPNHNANHHSTQLQPTCQSRQAISYVNNHVTF